MLIGEHVEYLWINEERLFVVYAASSILSNYPTIFVTPFVPCLMKAEIRSIYQSAGSNIGKMTAKVLE